MQPQRKSASLPARGETGVLANAVRSLLSMDRMEKTDVVAATHGSIYVRELRAGSGEPAKELYFGTCWDHRVCVSYEFAPAASSSCTPPFVSYNRFGSELIESMFRHLSSLHVVCAVNVSSLLVTSRHFSSFRRLSRFSNKKPIKRKRREPWRWP